MNNKCHSIKNEWIHTQLGHLLIIQEIFTSPLVFDLVPVNIFQYSGKNLVSLDYIAVIINFTIQCDTSF